MCVYAYKHACRHMGILLIHMGTTSIQFPQRPEEGDAFPEIGVDTIVSYHTGAGKQTSI